MLRVPVSAPSARVARRDRTGLAPSVLHLGLSSSAAIRLAPVAAALPGPQMILDPSGDIAAWAVAEPPPMFGGPLPSPIAVARAVAQTLDRIRPDVALVAGDGDAALAATLAAVRAGVPVARIGAGLRCGDRGAQREINRIAIDELATRLYTDSEVADAQLRSEGVDESRIHRVGSTVHASVGRWRDPAFESAAWERLGLRKSEYVLISLRQRQSYRHLDRLVEAVATLGRRYPIVLSVDACSRALLQPAGHLRRLASAGAIVTGPLNYVEFLSLEAGAGAVLTDSAAVQEECTALGVACFTLARSSERSLTLTSGTNLLLGDDPAAIEYVTVGRLDAAAESLPVRDGDAGRRVAADLLDFPWEDA